MQVVDHFITRKGQKVGRVMGPRIRRHNTKSGTVGVEGGGGQSALRGARDVTKDTTKDVGVLDSLSRAGAEVRGEGMDLGRVSVRCQGGRSEPNALQ